MGKHTGRKITVEIPLLKTNLKASTTTRSNTIKHVHKTRALFILLLNCSLKHFCKTLIINGTNNSRKYVCRIESTTKVFNVKERTASKNKVVASTATITVIILRFFSSDTKSPPWVYYSIKVARAQPHFVSAIADRCYHTEK